MSLFRSTRSIIVTSSALLGLNYCNLNAQSDKSEVGVDYETGEELTNWSGTHTCKPGRLYEPRNEQEVMKVLADHHRMKKKVRAVGTALSPNGLGMSDQDVMCLSQMDSIRIDKERQEVTVGGGARVSQVLSALKKEGYTLENFSSIQEQQMAGWTQVSAHGTGCGLSTVDEMVVRMKLATPTNGLMVLSDKDEPWLFKWARVGLGALGVVTELTLRIIPAFNLKQSTTVLTGREVSQGHAERLANNRHCRYMWIPNTQDTVSVLGHPTSEAPTALPSSSKEIEEDVTEPLKALLRKCTPHSGGGAGDPKDMSFAQLRDALLDVAPLDAAHIRAVNRAEASFWKRTADEGPRVADSTELLGFDCGGQQWVLEVCFPIGTLHDVAAAEAKGGEGSKDISFVRKVLGVIEKEGIAAPSPIEQRWTARSTSPMSPAYSTDEKAIFSWVGVIMYLPPGQDAKARSAITNNFKEYVSKLQPIFDEYGAKTHWAKIEVPPVNDLSAQVSAKARLQQQYPLHEFLSLKAALDPNAILSNDFIERLLG